MGNSESIIVATSNSLTRNIISLIFLGVFKAKFCLRATKDKHLHIYINCSRYGIAVSERHLCNYGLFIHWRVFRFEIKKNENTDIWKFQTTWRQLDKDEWAA